jgi:periplasmic protein TonB
MPLFYASSALRQEFCMAQEAATTGADIFVDTAEAAPLCQAMHPADFCSADRPAGRGGESARKRWILPALCSAALHLLLLALLLFAPDLERTRPAWGVDENRVITLALVEMPTVGTAAPVPAPPPPAPTVRPKRRAAPKPSAAMAAQAPIRPLPEPASAESASLEIASDDEASAAGESAAAAMPSEENGARMGGATAGGADVRASVPLYDLNPPPDYPAAARRRNLQGTVLLEVLVDRHGRASQVRISRSCGHDLLDRSALASVKQWHFEPARRMGQPQEMWVQVPVRFQLQ